MLISDIEQLKTTKIFNNKLGKFYTGTKLDFKCDNCGKIWQALYSKMNKAVHNCRTCNAKINGAKSKGWLGPNKTHITYWINLGFSKDYAKLEIRKLRKTRKEFWINKGLTENDAQIKANECLKLATKSSIEYWLNKGFTNAEAEKNRILYNRQTNRLCIEHWRKRGFTEEEARLRISKDIRPFNRLCIEFWLKRGCTKEEARTKILELQHNLHKTRDNNKISISNKKYWVELHKDIEKYNTYINKLSVSNLKHNRTHSPIYKEYWIAKGFSETEALIKRNEIRYTNNNGNLSSKIEQRFFNEFKEFSKLDIIRNKFLTSNKTNICPDGRYKNFIIEFNGTAPHMDSRFYDKNDINPFGKTFEQKHTADNIRLTSLLYNYNVYIVWQYDFLNKKELVFNHLYERLMNETCEKGKCWSSDSL